MEPLLINFKAKTMRIRGKWTKDRFIICHSHVISLINSGNRVHGTNYKWFATSDIIRQVFWKFIDTSIQNQQSILGFLIYCTTVPVITAENQCTRSILYTSIYVYVLYNIFFFFGSVSGAGEQNLQMSSSTSNANLLI